MDSTAVSDVHNKPYLAAVRRKQWVLLEQWSLKSPHFQYVSLFFFSPNPWLFPQAIILNSKSNFPFLLSQ